MHKVHTQSRTRSLTHSLIDSFTHSITHRRTHASTHPRPHVLTHPLSPTPSLTLSHFSFSQLQLVLLECFGRKFCTKGSFSRRKPSVFVTATCSGSLARNRRFHNFNFWKALLSQLRRFYEIADACNFFVLQDTTWLGRWMGKVFWTTGPRSIAFSLQWHICVNVALCYLFGRNSLSYYLLHVAAPLRSGVAASMLFGVSAKCVGFFCASLLSVRSGAAAPILVCVTAACTVFFAVLFFFATRCLQLTLGWRNLADRSGATAPRLQSWTFDDLCPF